MRNNRTVNVWHSWAGYLLSVVRMAAAFLFIEHGGQKLLAFPAGLGPHGITVPLWSLMGLAGTLELVGGGLLLVGLFTRPVAFVLAGEMAVAYFMGHARGGFWPLLNHGELAVLYAFVWLYISAAGAGPWSIDALLHREKARSANL